MLGKPVLLARPLAVTRETSPDPSRERAGTRSSQAVSLIGRRNLARVFRAIGEGVLICIELGVRKCNETAMM